MPVPSDVIITSDVTKLPDSIAALVDVTRPLPPGVAFFAKRVTFADVAKAAALAIAFALAGILITIFGVALLKDDLFGKHKTVTSGVDYAPLGFGLVCLLASWMMASAIGPRSTIMRRQRQGQPTRVGIFLTPDALIEAGESTYCVIPRARFRGLDGVTVRYAVRDQPKSIRLPPALVGADTQTMSTAVNQWAVASPMAGER